jgi:hypothetical protein
VDTKLNVSVGDISFSGEGDQGWLAEQLDKVLKAAPQIAKARPVPDDVVPKKGEEHRSGGFTTTLAAYIREKQGETNQVERFLITADWLRRTGSPKLSTVGVSQALKDKHQKKLSNPADCLNSNVSKGYCEKADGGFYITPDGLKHLGYAD